jgi:2'-hydroxyisoflavone reductase
MLAANETGAYNTATPPGDLTMQSLLECCCHASNEETELVWASDSFLQENEVGAWMELPLWIPESEPIARGFFDFVSTAAINRGLAFRSLEETVRDTMAWSLTRPEEHAWRGGLPADRETKLIADWLRNS